MNIGLVIPNHVTQTSFTVNETTCCLSNHATLLFRFKLISYTQSLVIHYRKINETGIPRDPGINRVPGYRFRTRVPVLSTNNILCLVPTNRSLQVLLLCSYHCWLECPPGICEVSSFHSFVPLCHTFQLDQLHLGRGYFAECGLRKVVKG